MSGESLFHLDQDAVFACLDHQGLVPIVGAGHYNFCEPRTASVFDLCRRIFSDYHKRAPGAPGATVADEDIVDIALTMLGIEPMPRQGFWSRYLSGQLDSFELDVAAGRCRFVSIENDSPEEPVMMHFAADEAPFVYFRQLRRLHARFDIPSSGLLRQAAGDYVHWRVVHPLKRSVKRLLQRWGDVA